MKQKEMSELINSILDTNRYDNRIIELDEYNFSELVADLDSSIIDGYFVLNREFRYPETNIKVVNIDYKEIPVDIIYAVVNGELVRK